MNEFLTVERLKELEAGIFAKGVTVDSPDGVNVSGSGRQLKWVATRGRGPLDWAIYVESPYRAFIDYESVASLGDKIQSPVIIKRLVPCDDEALENYRR